MGLLNSQFAVANLLAGFSCLRKLIQTHFAKPIISEMPSVIATGGIALNQGCVTNGVS